MSADGPATYWARTATANGGAVDGAELERRAVSVAPAYADVVTRAVSRAVADVRAARAARLATLAEEDPAAAAEVGRSTGRSFALLVGVLAAAGAASLYFSRAEFDAEAVLPLAVVLVVACATLTALALLPLRPAVPPTRGVVVVAWFMSILCAGSLTMAGVLGGVTDRTGTAVVVGLVGLAGLAILALAVTVMFLRTPAERRARTRERVAAFPGEVAEVAGRSVRDVVAGLHDDWAEVAPAARAAIEADLAEALRVLEERGLRASGRSGVPGGFVVVRTAIAVLPALEGRLEPV